jgi:hypothetical protein
MKNQTKKRPKVTVRVRTRKSRSKHNQFTKKEWKSILDRMLYGLFTSMVVESMRGGRFVPVVAPQGLTDCKCQGKCQCHSLGPLGGKSCPPTCKQLGTRFDGCHDCDCEEGKYYTPSRIARREKGKKGKK